MATKTKAVFYGRSLKRIPLSSFPATVITSRGVGGIIRPRNFFVPNKVKSSIINSITNVPDLTAQQTSQFANPKVGEHDHTPPSKTLSVPIFKPIAINEFELKTLENNSKKRKRPQFREPKKDIAKQSDKKSRTTVTGKMETNSRTFNHRVKII
jgi:hypothetical protein